VVVYPHSKQRDIAAEKRPAFLHAPVAAENAFI